MELSSEDRERIYQEEKARHEARRRLQAETAGERGALIQLVLGLSGAAVLFIGAFLPLVSLPVVGTLNYFDNGLGDGVIIVILAGLSGVFAAIRKPHLLWITGLGSLGVHLGLHRRCRPEPDRRVAGR